VTGSWEGEVEVPGDAGEKLALRLRLLDDGSGKLKGTLRCDAVSDELVELTGTLQTVEPAPAAQDTPAEGEEKDKDKDDQDKDKEPEKEKEKKKPKKDEEKAAPVRTVTLSGLGTRGPVSVSGTVVVIVPI
jgi:hypothetical protein